VTCCAASAEYNVGQAQDLALRFFDIGQEAVGFIAIGQFATGVFAFGQVAVGFVAVGQMASGVFTVGQGAVGLVSVGMGGVGIYWTGAMIGIGGSGFGGVVPLAPALGDGSELPDSTSWDVAASGDWVPARIDDDAPSRLSLPEGVRVHANLRHALSEAKEGNVLVHLDDTPAGLFVDRVMTVPLPRWQNFAWYAVWSAQMLALVVLCTIYVGALIIPWLQTLAFG
jgi:hypothetical protein